MYSCFGINILNWKHFGDMFCNRFLRQHRNYNVHNNSQCRYNGSGDHGNAFKHNRYRNKFIRLN